MVGIQTADFNYVASSDGTNRPSAANGTTVTGSTDAYGSFAGLGAFASAIPYDCYRILITAHSTATGAQSKNALLKVGWDPAGGTAFGNQIPHLLCGNASAWNVTGVMPGLSQFYLFDLFIPAGSTIGAALSVHNATPGTAKVLCWLFGRPKNPKALRPGQFVRTFGEQTASSSGTTITEGTTSEGAWTQLGSNIAAGDDLRNWQFGVGYDNTTAAASTHYGDLSAGDGTTQRMLIENRGFGIAATPAIGVYGGACVSDARVAPGNGIYGRMQSNTTAQTTLSMIAYAVGG